MGTKRRTMGVQPTWSLPMVPIDVGRPNARVLWSRPTCCFGVCRPNENGSRQEECKSDTLLQLLLSANSCNKSDLCNDMSFTVGVVKLWFLLPLPPFWTCESFFALQLPLFPVLQHAWQLKLIHFPLLTERMRNCLFPNFQLQLWQWLYSRINQIKNRESYSADMGLLA